MGNRNTRRKYKDIETKSKTNIRIEQYNAIKQLVRENKLSKALSDIEEYVENYPDDCFGVFLYASILMNLNQLEEAKVQLNKLIDNEDKNMYSAMYHLGCIERRQGNMDEAKEMFERVIKESPYEEGFSKIELAQIEYETDNFEKAKQLLCSVKGNQENHAKLELSRMELNNNKNVNAFNIISTIPKTDNDIFNRKVSLQKGKIEASFGNYKYAQEYFEEALVGPRNSTYWLTVLEEAKLENQFGNYDKALALCQNMISNKALLKNEVYLVMGQILENKKEYDEAKKNYLIITEAPIQQEKEKGYFYLGLLAFKQKKYDEAIDYFNKVQKGKLYKRGAMFNMVHVEIRRKDYQQAEKYLNKMLEEKLIEDYYDHEYRKLKILIDKGLNRQPSIREYINYSEKQYASYDVQEAIQYIKQEHYGSDSKSNFNEDINVQDLFSFVTSKLTEDNLGVTDLADNYYINYPKVGYTLNKEDANCIKVAVVPNTKNIITMYPIAKNTVKSEVVERPKQKRLSQIEKFNKKYNLK